MHADGCVLRVNIPNLYGQPRQSRRTHARSQMMVIFTCKDNGCIYLLECHFHIISITFFFFPLILFFYFIPNLLVPSLCHLFSLSFPFSLTLSFIIFCSLVFSPSRSSSVFPHLPSSPSYMIPASLSVCLCVCLAASCKKKNDRQTGNYQGE